MKHNAIGLLLFGASSALIVFLMSKAIVDSKDAKKFKHIKELTHDAITLNYREHEYTIFMVNGQILSPIHDAACVKCNGLMIEGK